MRALAYKSRVPKVISRLFISLYRFVDYEIMPDYGTFDIFRDQKIEEDLDNYPNYLAQVFEVIPIGVE